MNLNNKNGVSVIMIIVIVGIVLCIAVLVSNATSGNVVSAEDAGKELASSIINSISTEQKTVRNTLIEEQQNNKVQNNV